MAIRNQILQVLNETILTRNIWSMKGQPSTQSQDKTLETYTKKFFPTQRVSTTKLASTTSTTSMPTPSQDKTGNIHFFAKKIINHFFRMYIIARTHELDGFS